MVKSENLTNKTRKLNRMNSLIKSHINVVKDFGPNLGEDKVVTKETEEISLIKGTFIMDCGAKLELPSHL